MSDTEYAELLACDALLVTASLDEGYGLPIAESLALGTPAIVSDLDIFHEVAGEGARYFNPNDPQSFAAHVAAASNPVTYKQLRNNGKQHIAQYTWTSSAHTLIELSRSLTK
ncbi:D-inositol-3-phosphate glycosyltransferase [compost metagenome]